MNEAAKYWFQVTAASPIGNLVCVQARVSQHFREFVLVNRESVRSVLKSVRLTDFP